MTYRKGDFVITPEGYVGTVERLENRAVVVSIHRWYTPESLTPVADTVDFAKEISVGDKYAPAMKITNILEAKTYFERCVRHAMSRGCTREEAERVERANLTYFSGYYDTETMERVSRLFGHE